MDICGNTAYFRCALPCYRKLKKAMGTVTGGDAISEESEHDRSIRIDDEMSGHEISVDFYGTGIHKDEFVIVHYLPHTKTGYIVAKGQE